MIFNHRENLLAVRPSERLPSSNKAEAGSKGTWVLILNITLFLALLGEPLAQWGVGHRVAAMKVNEMNEVLE